MTRPLSLSVFLSLAFFLFFAPPASADPIYQLSGTFLIVGNSGCNPTSCTETINFSFALAPHVLGGVQLDPGFSTNSLSTTGPLTGMSVGNPQESFATATYVQDVRSLIAGSCATPTGLCSEIDFSYILQQSGSGYTFSSFGAQWFTCEGSCAPDFTSTGLGLFGFDNGYAPITIENLSFSQVPEPSTNSMLALGVFCILLATILLRPPNIRKPVRVTASP